MKYPFSKQRELDLSNWTLEPQVCYVVKRNNRIVFHSFDYMVALDYITAARKTSPWYLKFTMTTDNNR